jgi:hypothetical protein
MAKKTTHPMDGARDAALATIKKIAYRAVMLYAEHDIRIDRRDVLMDITHCHFSAQKLRLDDLLAADDANFLHDVAGINRHLNRYTGELTDCFSPRFSARTKEPA